MNGSTSRPLTPRKQPQPQQQVSMSPRRSSLSKDTKTQPQQQVSMSPRRSSLSKDTKPHPTGRESPRMELPSKSVMNKAAQNIGMYLFRIPDLEYLI